MYKLNLEYIYIKVVIAIKYYLFSRVKLLLAVIVIFITLAAILILLYFNFQSIHTARLVMGATLVSQKNEDEPKPKAPAPGKPDFEKYFRPSKLPVLNNRIVNDKLFTPFYNNKPLNPSIVKVPDEYFKSPEESIIYYFSILRDAENLTSEKIGGCGTVGASDAPYPAAYNFLAPQYKKSIDFSQYLKSFEGIGHTNLIKLRKLSPDQLHLKDLRYFIEIETIEGYDKGLTYFAYYYGFIYMQKYGDKYLISDMTLTGEDFLCAAYHGWSHDAEANVAIRYGGWCKMIEEKYPTKQEGYVKLLSFKGTDGSDYMIEFMHLTNDTDIEVAQYKKDADGLWKVVYLNPEKCVEHR